MGFDAEWGVLGADDLGAPHVRKRIWILANAHGAQRERIRITVRVPEEHTNISRRRLVGNSPNVSSQSQMNWPNDWTAIAPTDSWCLGNGQVPAVAATAFKLLSERGSR